VMGGVAGASSEDQNRFALAMTDSSSR
jgi:hypothetical protein